MTDMLSGRCLSLQGQIKHSVCGLNGFLSFSVLFTFCTVVMKVCFSGIKSVTKPRYLSFDPWPHLHLSHLK